MPGIFACFSKDLPMEDWNENTLAHELSEMFRLILIIMHPIKISFDLVYIQHDEDWPEKNYDIKPPKYLWSLVSDEYYLYSKYKKGESEEIAGEVIRRCKVINEKNIYSLICEALDQPVLKNHTLAIDNIYLHKSKVFLFDENLITRNSLSVKRGSFVEVPVYRDDKNTWIISPAPNTFKILDTWITVGPFEIEFYIHAGMSIWENKDSPEVQHLILFLRQLKDLGYECISTDWDFMSCI